MSQVCIEGNARFIRVVLLLRNDILSVVRIFDRILKWVLLSTLDHYIGLRRWVLRAYAFLLSLDTASHRSSIRLQTIMKGVEIEMNRAK
jgi:hypothetical protein